MKKLLAILMMAVLAFTTATACSSDKNASNEENTTKFWQNLIGGGETSPEINGQNGNSSSESPTENTEKFDIDVNYSDKEQLSLTSSEVTNYKNVITLGSSDVNITASGEYVIEGTLNDSQIIVDVPDTDAKVVTLIFNGVNITCSDSAPVYVKNADKVVISLVKGTTNTLTDGTSYTYDDATEEEPNACIFSKDDLVISGEGTLNVNANFNNGIASKDDLTITGGIINVKAANNGIKGKDSIAIKTANITVDAVADGLKSDNADEAEKGFILIEDGTYKITSGEDAIQAETCLEIKGGTFDITTGEGATITSWGNSNDWGKPGMNWGSESNTSSSTEASIKAIKAGCDVTISGGTFTISSEDDAIHSNVTAEINGGIFNIKSGDDGIHADDTLTINSGDITITQCYEGIEATYIIMNDGNVHVVSTDDGFNAAGGNDSSAMGKRPGMNPFAEGTGSLTINGGYVYIDASGDGLDANGTFNMSGGFVIVNGPDNSGNGAFDYGSSCTVTGGFLIAVGASGMAQMPSSATINCVMVTLNKTVSAGTLMNISDSAGNTVLTFEATKSYNNLVLCTQALQTGETYTVSTGGTVTGDDTDGIYEGVYSGGTEQTTFTVEGTLTGGNSGGGFGGGMGGNMGGGFGGGFPGGGRK